MADVLLTSTEEVIQLVSVSGASQGDITTAVTAHNALATAHGLNANIFAALTGAASPSAGNVLATDSAVDALIAEIYGTSNTWTAGQTFDFGALPSGQARTVFEFKPLSGSATDPSNFLVMNTQEFDIGSPFCSSLYFGFNLGAGGTRVMAGHPAIGFVTEGNWFQGGVQYAEAHCFYVTKANVQYRPFSITVNTDTDNIAFAHYADSIGFSGKLGYSVFSMTLGADAAHSNIAISAPVHMTQSFQFDAGGSFNCAVNNVLFLNQLNAAGNGYIPIAFVDSSNIIELGPSGAVAVYLNIPLRIAGYLQHEGSRAGFYGTTPIVKQTGVAVSAAGIHAALVNLGLISA